MKIEENTKDRIFEIILLAVGLLGLLILFTLLYAGPRFLSSHFRGIF